MNFKETFFTIILLIGIVLLIFLMSLFLPPNMPLEVRLLIMFPFGLFIGFVGSFIWHEFIGRI